MADLTPRENKFVAEYLVDLNQTQAAIRAGYSPRTAGVHGSRLYKKANVRAEIEAALKRRSDRVEVRQDDVLRELIRIYGADIGQAYDANGKLKKLHEMPEEIRRCIVGVKAKELFEGYGEDRKYIGDLVEVKFADKVKAIELAMRHLGLLVEKHKHEFDASFAVMLKEARARAAKR